jgi:hypothetical protein
MHGFRETTFDENSAVSYAARTFSVTFCSIQDHCAAIMTVYHKLHMN